MNRHTKVAIVIAPFLAIGGFIAADYYGNYKAAQETIIHQLKVEGECKLEQNQCTLSGGGLVLKLSNSNGITQVLSNHPLERAVISEVGTSGDNPRQLSTNEERLEWQIEKEKYTATPGHSENKLRFVATVKNQIFISEFSNQGE